MSIKNVLKTLLASLIIVSSTQTQAMWFNWLGLPPIGTRPVNPLFEAHNIEEVHKLIAAGTDPNFKNENGITALTTAAFWGDTEMAQALIDEGADLNVRSKSGDTALMYATSAGNIKTVQALIDASADLNLRNRYGKTPLMIARDKGYADIERLIIKEQARKNTNLHQACGHGLGARTIELLLHDEKNQRTFERLYGDRIDIIASTRRDAGLPIGTITPRIKKLIRAERANLDVANAHGFTARQYLCARAWLKDTVEIAALTLTTRQTLLQVAPRGTKIAALKRMLAPQLPDAPALEHMRLQRLENEAEATNNELVGSTQEFIIIE